MIAVVAAALIPIEAADGAGGVRHGVDIRRFVFVPVRVIVAPGDTVVWVNRDPVPHTLSAEDGSWDSQALEPNARWELRVTGEMTGTYFCRYHPGMRGQVHVQRRERRARAELGTASAP